MSDLIYTHILSKYKTEEPGGQKPIEKRLVIISHFKL
jgi:hypothetical protein